jgi:biopolymer transport protein ExbD
MRRFSQRNSLVTLNEINITPLLDLAFVLLIIFVITRPALEQSIYLDLPREGKIPQNNEVDTRDILVLEIDSMGHFRLRGQPVNGMAVLEAKMKQIYSANPKTIIQVRTDKRAPSQYMMDVLYICTANNMTRVQFQTAPVK